MVIPITEIMLLIISIFLMLMDHFFMAMIVLLFLFGINGLTETFPIHINIYRLKRKDSIRILSYNINRAYSESQNKGSTSELIDFIEKQEADIVLLQEYNSLLYPEIAESLIKKLPYTIIIDSHDNRFKSVFSKYPIEESEQLCVGSEDSRFSLFRHEWYSGKKVGGKEMMPISSLVIKVGEKILRLVNCHLMSNNFSVVYRNASHNLIDFIRLVPSIMKRVDFGYSVRKLQTEVLVSYLSNKQEKRIVVCGDFNDVCGSSTINLLNRMGLSDCWWKKGCGFGFTFHGMWMWLRLDHILFSPQTIQINNVKVPHSNFSDHYPIIVDLVLI